MRLAEPPESGEWLRSAWRTCRRRPADRAADLPRGAEESLVVGRL